jgi:hypothetical protein
MKATEELYELRNYYTAENLIYRELGPACDALQRRMIADKAKRDPHFHCWCVSRVSDGAFWQGAGCTQSAPHPTATFGRRIYTVTGDALRLELAAKRIRG